RRETIQNAQQGNLLMLLLKAAGHSMSDRTTKRPAQDVVGPRRLNLPYQGRIIINYLFNVGRQGLSSCETGCLQAVDRPVNADFVQQPGIYPAMAAARG